MIEPASEKQRKQREDTLKFYNDPAFQITRGEDSPHYQEVMKRAPHVNIDRDACGNALECLKCLQACGNRVLCMVPYYHEEEPAQRMEPPTPEFSIQVWKKGIDGINPEARPRYIWPFMPEVCTYPGCHACVDVCPKKAISIDISHLLKK